MLALISELLEQEYIQYGFAFFCLVLIGVIVWLLIKFVSVHDKLIDVINQSNRVQAKCIEALNRLDDKEENILGVCQETKTELNNLRIQIAQRPCQQGNLP